MRLLLIPLLGLMVLRGAGAASIQNAAGHIVLSVGSDGAYAISSQPQAWTWKGKLPAHVADIQTRAGSDALGPWQELAVQFTGSSRASSVSFRLYSKEDVLLFSQTCSEAGPTPAPFPDFTSLPQGLLPFSYGPSPFSPPEFDALNICTPWLLFDASAHAAVISPASHFASARMLGDARTRAGSGFGAKLEAVPAGFTQRTLIAFANGINAAWDAWGGALTRLQGKIDPPSNTADVTLRSLGYWTDNGGSYWYDYDKTRGYQGTMEAILAEYREKRIPVQYLQLDSWWYQKSLTNFNGSHLSLKNPMLPEGEWNRYGGTMKYEAHPFIFPKGLAAFHEIAGVPLVTHNRWIDRASPYQKRYKFTGIAGVDPAFWNEIADYLASSGVIEYEQDWLSAILRNSPGLEADPALGDAFFDSMAGAFQKHGMSVQYCMGTPTAFLAGAKYSNLTSIRVSDDRLEPHKYHDFLYTSRFAKSIGSWPWSDVFKSTETINLLMSTLSAGPVGIGDALGEADRKSLLRAVRPDGIIVKPDVPIIPIDDSYVSEATEARRPLVASSWTDFGPGQRYVYAAVLRSSGTAPLALHPADIGCAPGPCYCYDWFAGRGARLGATDLLPLSGTSAVGYYVVAPIGSSGIALLGATDNFASLGRARISSVTDRDGHLVVDVIIAAGEDSVTLRAWAPSTPMVAPSDSTVAVQTDTAVHLYTIILRPSGTSAEKLRTVRVELTLATK